MSRGRKKGVRLASTAKKKQKLLAMAKAGKPRPSTPVTWGRVLANYTCDVEDNGCYDAVFDKQIRLLRPDWFAPTAKEKKKSLLREARRKPRWHRLGKLRPQRFRVALQHYTTRTHPDYDATFSKLVRKLAPHWFISNKTKRDKKKKKLLAIAKAGKPRPYHGCALGRALAECTCQTSCLYDVDFDKQIRRLSPSWFRGNRQTQKVEREKAKEKLLQMAAAAKPRPHRKSVLGRTLARCTSPTSCVYDSVFDRRMRKLAPQWFRTTK